MSNHDHTIRVDWTHRVHFTRGAFDAGNPLLADLLQAEPTSRGKLLVVTEQTLVAAHPTLQSQIAAYTTHHGSAMPELVGFLALPGGESVKNDLSWLESLLGELNRHGIDRRSTVLAIGGGALLDMVGFAAAVTHRGVRLVRMPTTTLSQGDSGVGVKNGVNMFGKKNFIGTFAVPHAVVNDLALLETLPERDWRCGLAEAVKVALLKDADFYRDIHDHCNALAARDAAVGDRVWQRSAELHLQHIIHGGDPFESLEARPLDFGHWAAHKLEQLSGFELRHGEAVAIGLALDVTYAARVGLLPHEVADDILTTLARLGFELFHPALLDASLLQGLTEFREHLGGRLTITLIQAVGQPIDVHEIDTDAMRQAITSLSQPHASAIT